MAKVGRPRIDIDKKMFEKLCAMQCTEEDIAMFFDCSKDTLERWCRREYHQNFAAIFKQKRVKGIVSLRASGWQMAQKIPSVHIFYCKNHLGMTDQVEVHDEKADERVNKLIEAIKSV